MRKKGISLVVLLITVLLLLVLLSTVTITVGNAINNSKKSAFASDISSIEDSVNVYYIQNGEFPILSEDEKYVKYVYNTNTLVDKDDETNKLNLNEEYIDTFNNELISNFDLTNGENVVSDTVFYKIDLKKINVEKTKRGTGENGDNDIYVMAYPSQNIYYLKGLVVNNEAYFSIINLVDYQKVNDSNQQANDTTEIIQEVAGISVKREKKAWSNTLDIVIDGYLEENESIYVSIPEIGKKIKLDTIVGQNIIKLNSLDGSLGLTIDDLEAFNNLESSQKYFLITKVQGTIELGSIKINLSNYETEAPIVPLKADGVTLDFDITSNEGENVVSFDAKDNISGIKEVRYIYLKKFDENGIPKSVYTNENGEDITEFTSEYMLQNGKKAYVAESGRVNINLPKDVEAIYIAMYDKAGNSVCVTKNVSTDIYIGINLKNITTDLVFNYAIKSVTNITSAKVSISSDGITFTNEQELNLTKGSNGLYTSTSNFVNSNFKEVYIKAIVTNESITEIRIKKIDISSKAYEIVNSVVPGIIYSDNKTYTDKNGDTAIVPAGFRVSTKTDEQIINDGLVILDKQDNEYVWIPCTIDGTNGSIKYEKWNGTINNNWTVTKEQVEDDILPSGITSETEQIIKYGGFYVARYEAGLPDEQTTETLMATKTFSADDNNRTDIGKAQSKADKIVWNRISYNNAKAVSETVISTEYVQTGLITGTQWDTMLKFLSQEVDVDTDCIAWGNYKDKYGYTIKGYYRIQNEDVIYTNGEYTKSSNSYLLLQTGKFGSVVSEGSPKNIYDVAGNVWEWTAERVTEQGGQYTTVGNHVTRGGGYDHGGSNTVASYRGGENTSTDTYTIIGFRFVLYIK